jgi:hypothetical protein
MNGAGGNKTNKKKAKSKPPGARPAPGAPGLLKRGINGTYVSVEPFHLFRYLDEQSFRYNNPEDMGDGDRFVEAMNHIVGRRVTYAQLTGKGTDSIHQGPAGTWAA